MARFRKAPAPGTGLNAEVDIEALRAQAALSMERAQRMASDDPVVRARAMEEARAENAALFASGARTPSVVGWYRGPGDPEHIERFWDGHEWTIETRDLTVPVEIPDFLPFAGEVLWLTAEQGGRPAGPPRTAGVEQLTAYVPPAVVEAGVVPFVLREFVPGAWRSSAVGGWLTHDGTGPGVRAGSMIVLTDDTTPVGYFSVRLVEQPEPQAPALGRAAY